MGIDYEMARKLEVEIQATAHELKQLLHLKERVQVLYWLKTRRVETALSASEWIG